MHWFVSADRAREAFAEQRKQPGIQGFHGYPPAMLEEDSSDLPGGRNEYRIGLWAPGQWLVEVKAFDDTPSLSAPAPEAVLEAIYGAGKDMGFFKKK